MTPVPFRRSGAALLALCAAVLLAGCGGERDDAPDGGPPPGQAGSPGEQRLPDGQLGTLERDRIGLALPWTVGQVDRDADEGAGTATARSLELRALPGADRLLITFDSGGAVPGYRVSGTIEPLRECATGDTIPVEGEGLLQIRLEGTRPGDGLETPSVKGSGLANVRSLRMACSRDGTVEWVLSVRRATFYRTVEASGPPRLAVDVKHPEEEAEGTGPGGS